MVPKKRLRFCGVRYPDMMALTPAERDRFERWRIPPRSNYKTAVVRLCKADNWWGAVDENSGDMHPRVRKGIGIVIHAPNTAGTVRNSESRRSATRIFCMSNPKGLEAPQSNRKAVVSLLE